MSDVGKPPRQVAEENELLRRRVADLEAEVRQCRTTLTSSAQRARQESEQDKLAERLLQNIIESSGDIIFVLDREYKYLSFNARHREVMKALYGVDIELGKNLFDYQRVTEDHVQAKRNLDRALAGERLTEEAFSGEQLRGRVCFEVAHNPIRDDSGSIVGVSVFAHDMTERRRMEEKLKHLNLALQAIRNVNQLIVREKDAETLIRRACEILTETRGYNGVWIALYDEAGAYRMGASAGLGDVFPALEAHLRHGQLGACARALQQPGVCVVKDPATECRGCPAAPLYAGQSAIAVRLEHGGKVLGLLLMSMDPALTGLAEEQSLIEEVADDIAFALMGKQVEREIESLARFPGENPQPVMRLGPDGKVLYANPSSRDLLAAWSCGIGDRVPPVMREALAGAIARQAKSMQEVAVDDRIFSILIAPIPGADYVNLYGRDITSRARAEAEIRRLNTELERRVVERTAQLAESNRELEAFSYSVSHDLRAPLRAMDGFTRILLDEYGPKLDAEGKRICGIIRQNTGRMGTLIDDLLAFSRLGRAEMQPSMIDMGTLAASVFHELTTPESRNRIDFRAGEIPPAVGDPSLMRQVWTNLIGNAIKFSSKRERGVIEVSGEQTEHEIVYSVRDNGAGFDMQYADKLFGVFQRLHGSRDFEGTGVGLALVQRVIRRHGGRVWAKGKVDGGATFSFAISRQGATA